MKIVDHILTHVTFDYLYEHHDDTQLLQQQDSKKTGVNWDYDLMMECVTKGKNRVEFMDVLEKSLEVFRKEGEMERALAKPSPDEYFDKFDEIVLGVGERFFSKAAKNEDHEKIKARRMALLAERRQRREELGDCADEELLECEKKLEEATIACTAFMVKVRREPICGTMGGLEGSGL